MGMIQTALSHALIALLITIFGWSVGHLYVGAAVALGFYLGREVAQHERKTPGVNPLRGFAVWKWSLDAQLDLLFPVIAVGVVLFFL